MDDVIYAYKPRLLDVAAQLKRSAHAALGLAINCAIIENFEPQNACWQKFTGRLGDEFIPPVG